MHELPAVLLHVLLPAVPDVFLESERSVLLCKNMWPPSWIFKAEERWGEKEIQSTKGLVDSRPRPRGRRRGSLPVYKAGYFTNFRILQRVNTIQKHKVSQFYFESLQKAEFRTIIFVVNFNPFTVLIICSQLSLTRVTFLVSFRSPRHFFLVI